MFSDLQSPYAANAAYPATEAVGAAAAQPELDTTSSRDPSTTMSAPKAKRDRGIEAGICAAIAAGPDPQHSPTVAVHISALRRTAVLILLAFTLFFDTLGAYGSPLVRIQIDFHIPVSSQSWIISSYLVTYTSCLLFWGRVSDFYSPKTVLTYNFVIYGILTLVISFLPPNQYAFYVFRALQGICASALPPSSYRIVSQVYGSAERPKAYGMYSLGAALGNNFGNMLSGLTGFISKVPPELAAANQMTNWRWFFRIVAFAIFPFALASFFVLPKQCGACHTVARRFGQLDIGGVFLIFASMVLTTVGLTLAPQKGWGTAYFLAPFLIGIFVLLPAFFFWEARRPRGAALIPPSTWFVPNLVVVALLPLPLNGWWAVNQLAFMQVFVLEYKNPPALAAARLLPQGIIALIVAPILQQIPGALRMPRLRFTIGLGMVLGVAGYALMAHPTNYVEGYWRWLLPAFIVGSGGNMAAYAGANVALLETAPPSMAGVAGGLFQTVTAWGTTLALAAQAGLVSVHGGHPTDPPNVHAGFYFQMSWIALWLVLFLIARPGRSIDWARGMRHDEAKAEDRAHGAPEV